WAEALEACLLAGLRPATREVLQRVAVAGAYFGTDEFIALSGLAEEEAFGHLDDALAAELVEPAAAGYRFRHCLIREALTGAVPADREGLGGAGPARARRLRARLAHSAIMAGDLVTAEAALAGLDPDGGADDADIWLARGKYAFFTADFDAARAAADQAERLV